MAHRRSAAWIGALLVCAVAGFVRAEAADSSAEPTPDLPAELDQTDADLVDAAEGYLSEGRLGPAVEVAEQAAWRDPRSSVAHLLLARALSAVRVEHPGAVCTWDAWPDRIEQHVRAAWALDDSVLDRLETDAELADVREVLSDTIALRLWPTRGRAWRPTGPPTAVEPTGLPVMLLEGVVKRRHAEPLLVDLTWWGLDPVGEHDDTVLDLMADGSLVRARIERDADGTKHAVYAHGSWELDKAGLRIALDGEPAELFVTLGGLQVGSGEEAWIRWTDRPADCTRPFDVWAGLR